MKILFTHKRVPIYIWVLIILSILFPFVMSNYSSKGEIIELRWFMLLVPVFFISYYYGVKGGMIFSVLSNFFILMWELFAFLDGLTRYRWEYLIITFISFGISIGVGVLTHKLNQLTIKDPLTNLYNRRFIQTYKPKVNISILYIDIDRFKLINDSLGHSLGDNLLLAISERLLASADTKDIIVRLGGDEFILILHDQNIEETKQKAETILKKLSIPYIIDKIEIFLTASIGIKQGVNKRQPIGELITKADIAMYQSKKKGKNQYQVYIEDMRKETNEIVELERYLHRALEKDEFELYYQPRIELNTNTIVGMEALIRWNHPIKGLVPPGKFIPLAEETGLITPIGEWVLYTASKQNKEWQDAGFTPLIVSVNISARQFQHGLVNTVKRILNQSGLDPQWLELEITESMLMNNVDEAVQTLLELKDLGVQLSIDDFGTGFSSLNYITHFPIDYLKIDKSFVKDILTNPTIPQMIINLGHNLKVKVIAEGIEKQVQAEVLQSHHCDHGQGYIYSPPLPTDQFEQKFFH